MTPEVYNLITSLLKSIVEGAQLLIAAAVAYGVWKLRQMQQDNKKARDDALKTMRVTNSLRSEQNGLLAQANMERTKSDYISILNDTCAAGVAYVQQTQKLDKNPPQTAEEKNRLRKLAAQYVLSHLTKEIKSSLEGLFEGTAPFHSYILFRIEAEVARLSGMVVKGIPIQPTGDCQ